MLQDAEVVSLVNVEMEEIVLISNVNFYHLTLVTSPPLPSHLTNRTVCVAAMEII